MYQQVNQVPTYTFLWYNEKNGFIKKVKNMKYLDIANEINKRITDHVYEEQLPSEAQLMEEFSSGRNTIRSAISLLANHGIIRRHQGSGYFVNQDLFETGRNITMLTNKNSLNTNQPDKQIKSKVINFTSRLTTPKEDKIFGCQKKSPVYEVHRLRYIVEDNAFLSFEKAVFLKELIPYLDETIAQNSIFRFIKKQYDIEVLHSDDFLSVGLADEEFAEKTGQAVGSPYLLVKEINFTKKNKVFNYSHSYYSPDREYYYHLANTLK